MSDRVVHFEIPYDDGERARAFYGGVFGWHLQAWEGAPYTIVRTGPTDEDGIATEPGYIGGGMFPRQDPITTPVITIQVDDIATSLARIEEAGGTTVQAGEPVGEMGFAAYFTDSEGNLMGLWQTAGPDA